MTKQQKKAVAYLRYSSNMQNIESAEAQMRAIEKYAKDNNMIIVDVYQDLGETGTKVKKRIQFQKMIKDSKLGMFDFVLCHKIDRFARNTKDFLNYEKELNDNGVDVVAVAQPFGNSPVEKVAKTMMIVMAEMFSDNLSGEVKVKMEEYARKGLYCGGTVPFGYAAIDKKYIVNPVEAIAVKRMYELYSIGYGYSKIATMLKNEGFKTRDNQFFITNTIKRMLKNPIYKGEFTYGKYDSHKERKKGKSEPIRVKNNHEGIVSVDLWETVNKRVHQTTKHYTEKYKNVEGRVYLFTGTLKCGSCGCAFSGIRGYKKASYYMCGTHRRKSGICPNSKTLRREYFDAYIIDYVKSTFFSEENIKMYAKLVTENINEEDRDVTETLNELQKSIEKLDKRAKKLRIMYLDEEISDIEYKETKEEIYNTKDLYEVELYKLSVVSKKVEEETIIKYLTDIKNNFTTQDKDFLKLIMKQLVNKIVVFEDKVDVYLNLYNPYPEGAGNNIDMVLPEETALFPLVALGNNEIYRLESGIITFKVSFNRQIFTHEYRSKNK